METNPTAAHATASPTLADFAALQLGNAGRNHAVVSRGGEEKRSALFGSRRFSRCDPGTTRPSAAFVGHRIGGLARPCPLRLSEQRTMGIDCAIARHRLAWTETGLSHSATVGLELL